MLRSEEDSFRYEKGDSSKFNNESVKDSTLPCSISEDKAKSFPSWTTQDQGNLLMQ